MLVQNTEALMSQYDQLKYIFDKNMPEKQKGLYIDNVVYLNSNQTEEELYSTLAEEIAHYLTSYGDIIDQSKSSSRRQEKHARYVGASMTVSLDSLIRCHAEGLVYDWECAEYLGVTKKAFSEAIEFLKEKHGIQFIYKNFELSFELAGSLNIRKID